jgi:molybdopterin molybdotransferase
VKREFFTVRRVSEAQVEFRPARRTGVEVVSIHDGLGRVPARDVVAAAALPGFARSAVDGYAVRAADTFGASDGLPAYLDVVGEVSMGVLSADVLQPGQAIAVPTGGGIPAGADAVVMVEYVAVAVAGTLEVMRAAAPGEGVVAADEDVARGGALAVAGRPLRPADLALLAAAGVVEVEVHGRPLVAIISTGDEVVPPEAEPAPGQVRDSTAPGLAALVREAGGVPDLRGIVPDDPEALRRVLVSARNAADLVVVSAGSSVGARDVTAGVVATLGAPGIWCHGLALRPGKPTLLAECDGVPVIGLPGNPVSALVVFRLLGMPLVRRAGGILADPPEPTARVVLGTDVASEAGRHDIVQVRVVDGRAEPVFGRSALLSPLARADGYLVVPEAAGGLYAGAAVEVVLYR